MEKQCLRCRGGPPPGTELRKAFELTESKLLAAFSKICPGGVPGMNAVFQKQVNDLPWMRYRHNIVVVSAPSQLGFEQWLTTR